jgi:hypothetical protein
MNRKENMPTNLLYTITEVKNTWIILCKQLTPLSSWKADRMEYGLVIEPNNRLEYMQLFLLQRAISCHNITESRSWHVCLEFLCEQEFCLERLCDLPRRKFRMKGLYRLQPVL